MAKAEYERGERAVPCGAPDISLRHPNRLFASHLTGRAGNPCRNASLLYTGVESLIHAIPRSGCCKAANHALCMSLIWRFS